MALNERLLQVRAQQQAFNERQMREIWDWVDDVVDADTDITPSNVQGRFPKTDIMNDAFPFVSGFRVTCYILFIPTIPGYPSVPLLCN